MKLIEFWDEIESVRERNITEMEFFRHRRQIIHKIEKSLSRSKNELIKSNLTTVKSVWQTLRFDEVMPSANLF